jgi:hypothetical protein
MCRSGARLTKVVAARPESALAGIFTDLAVRERIKQAEQNVARSMQLVREVQGRLEQRAAHARARLATIKTERRELLT